MTQSLSFLCISTFFKGNEFLRSCKQAGNTVYLLTNKKLEHKPWAREFIDEVFYLEEKPDGSFSMDEIIAGLAYMMRSKKVDRIVALDDFDVEKAAHLREHFRIAGMGQTTSRHFRDKLAMRMKAQEAGVKVPMFTSLFNDHDIFEFTQKVTFPCVVKPRSEASATGIKKVYNSEQLWEVVHHLGDKRHEYLVEQFRPGDVFHVDSLSVDGKFVFTRCSQYLSTPMEVAHGGGIFRSVTVPFGSKDDKALQKANTQVMKAFGMKYSASHSEFIKDHETGEIIFLETASRVGGANLAEMVEASSGINLWREWAKIETAMAKGEDYTLPAVENNYSGIIISLSNQQHPNTESFNDSEIYWRIDLEYHIGFIVKSNSREKVVELLDNYAQKIYDNFHASAPIPDKSAH
ncbi:ATP-grasp domain-containing protein [Arcicella aurantiaca]|uniref:ATP-grasp domain-containing protein n=1 Tax=Arcicella aurantiaca TaxID=591202 RepID=A0A316ECH4_9BACT|nr:ATP-grasp domain-containing protein [Arcicella aurantiaca]PWK27359.1 ATP-grasp domain-containing protein [Arcicella aurantiaca]